MKIHFFYGLILLAISIKTFANGGPVDGSAVYQTGDIKLLKYEKIELVKEILKIKLEGDYSIVDVKYTLVNNGYSDSKITYGFPIELENNQILEEFEWNEEYLPEISFKANNKSLPIKHQVDISTFNKNVNGSSIEIKRSWHIVEFTIGKNENLELTVHYKVKNGFEDWATSKSFFASYSKRSLGYDFSPAQNWGDGVIDSMNVSVDASSIEQKGGKVKLDGLNFTRSNNYYTFNSKNFDLKNAKNLSISYDNESEKFSRFSTKYNVTNKIVKNISVSSKLKGNYSKKNLIDFNFNTAWVEGKRNSGIGEKIIFSINDYRLGAICMINGYTKDHETYINNNRIKKLKIDVEHIDYDDPKKTKISTSIVEIKDKKFTPISKEGFQPLTSIIADYGDGYVKVKKVTLTILEVYPGKKHNDTCISEILFLGYR